MKSKMWLMSLMSCLCLCIFLQGCTPLRKKFTRQKRAEKKVKFIPVLDPIDYPPPQKNPEERYAYHYSMWRIWNRDLLQTFDRKTSGKNQRYLVGQMIVQLQEMQKWVIQEKQQGIEDLMANLQVIKKMLSKPDPMRNVFSIKKKIELNVKRTRAQFKPALMEGNFSTP
ncbi:hypothetical protein MNBD_UNCLBAC01-8 [hydrothermal vent metagenome]|uniref:Lipoprotein n=1 Tax=hydrothermal vent metagenome TaxID=652676 RepID=A0A3B1DJY5_9ZZZZ